MPVSSMSALTLQPGCQAGRGRNWREASSSLCCFGHFLFTPPTNLPWCLYSVAQVELGLCARAASELYRFPLLSEGSGKCVNKVAKGDSGRSKTHCLSISPGTGPGEARWLLSLPLCPHHLPVHKRAVSTCFTRPHLPRLKMHPAARTEAARLQGCKAGPVVPAQGLFTEGTREHLPNQVAPRALLPGFLPALVGLSFLQVITTRNHSVTYKQDSMETKQRTTWKRQNWTKSDRK